jgi:hypothetical protein
MPLHSNGHGPEHKKNTVLLLLPACMLWALPGNSRCLQSHCLSMRVYATIYNYIQLYRTFYGTGYFKPSFFK